MARNAVADRRADPGIEPLPGAPHERASPPPAADDYFVERDGERFAGMHLLIELWGARHLDDAGAIERALRAAAEAAKATVLHTHFHRFTSSGGVSGVVVLAESHIGIHTWPERRFAAIDIFMCGACDPYDALPTLRRAFRPESLRIDERRRGRLR